MIHSYKLRDRRKAVLMSLDWVFLAPPANKITTFCPRAPSRQIGEKTHKKYRESDIVRTSGCPVDPLQSSHSGIYQMPGWPHPAKIKSIPKY
jgi:hypothetical protein